MDVPDVSFQRPFWYIHDPLGAGWGRPALGRAQLPARVGWTGEMGRLGWTGEMGRVG
jgi:hypothetical protein